MPQQRSLDGFGAAPKPTDRLFFAVFPEAAAAEHIAELAQRLRSQHGLKTDRLSGHAFCAARLRAGRLSVLPAW